METPTFTLLTKSYPFALLQNVMHINRSCPLKTIFLWVTLIIVGFGNINSVYSQLDVKKNNEYYLVDSLNVSSLSKSDKRLLDSLLPLYHGTKDDSMRIGVIADIANKSWDDHVWPKYNQLAYDEANRLIEIHQGVQFFVDAKANAISNFGFQEFYKGDYFDALVHFEQALILKRELSDSIGITNAYNNMGSVYDALGNTEKALELFVQAEKINKDLNKLSAYANVSMNIANILNNQGLTQKAYERYREILQIRRKESDLFGISHTSHIIGNYYLKQQEKDSAWYYINASLKSFKSLQNEKWTAKTLDLLGDYYYQYKNYDSAIYYLLQSRKILEENNFTALMTINYLKLGKNYRKKRNMNKAFEVAQKAYDIAKSISALDPQQVAAKQLYIDYESVGKLDSALKYHKLFVVLKDSLHSESVKKQLFNNELKEEFRRKQLKMKLDKEKTMELAELNSHRQKVIIYFLASGAFLLILFLLYVLNRFRVSRKQQRIIGSQRSILEKQNRKITDSITYAKRILRSITVSKEVIQRSYPDSFIFFKPKDVVSGDFHWAFELNEEEIITVVADCTGHGVPGAILSIICSNALDSVIRLNGVSSPENIMRQFNQELILKLNREKGVNTNRDGVELTITKYNKNTKKLHLCMVGHKALYFNQELNEMVEISGDRIPLADPKYLDRQVHTLHELNTNSNDAIYLFSDGYVDQKGGPNRKKYYLKTFADFIHKHANEPMEAQKTALFNEYNRWKGDVEQYDDVLVIGVKF